jgi:hypothetical protein
MSESTVELTTKMAQQEVSYELSATNSENPKKSSKSERFRKFSTNT